MGQGLVEFSLERVLAAIIAESAICFLKLDFRTE